MVHKIKFIKISIFALFALILGFFAFTSKGGVETNLLKTLMSDNIKNAQDIIKIANKSSSTIKIVFESDSEKNLENLKLNFIKNINKNDFQQKSYNSKKLLKLYISAPSNFLSGRTKNLLKSEKYDKIYEKSLEYLYSPAGINLSDFDKDPFMLSDDYILSLRNLSFHTRFENGKYYDLMTLKLKSNDALSPGLSNNKIKKIVTLGEKLSNKNSKIYLAGTPVHSYFTSKNAILNINIICILSLFLICFLTYFYFKNIKILIPILCAITFGMFIGFCATKIWFENFQVITMVFSTMLIGIGIDYSYHYFFSEDHDKTFIRNLTFSLVTTVIPFILLYLTGIELLCQITVFSVFGLIAVYLFVLIIYPEFEFQPAQKNIKINPNYIKILTVFIFAVSVIGFVRLNFNDNLNSLYSPSKKLIQAEKLYNNVSGQEIQTQFIVVYGKNLTEILSKEEKITSKLAQKNIDYVSISKFTPSEKIQKENFELIKKLYDKKLDNFNKILSSSQILKLKNSKFEPVNFNLKNIHFLNEFLIDKNTSVIIIFSDKNPQINEKIINIEKDVSQYLKIYRRNLLWIFPAILILIFAFLSGCYGVKNGIKLILPSVFGMFCSCGLALLIFGEINLFGVIALVMVLGFTIDYSIFRTKGGKHTEDSIFVSCFTTAFSFLLLSLTGFKLISSITFILFTGILSSYICGYTVFKKAEFLEKKDEVVSD